MLARLALGASRVVGQCDWAEQVCDTGDRQRLWIATRASRTILPVVRHHPNKVVVIDLRDVPLSFASLPSSNQWSFVRRFGSQDAVRQYESRVAMLLDAMVHKVLGAQPYAALSVLGLPIEPERGRISLKIAQQSNERYGTNPVPQLGLGGTLADGSGIAVLDRLDQLCVELGFDRYTDGSLGTFDLFCITAALMVGTAGLPHVIVRFYTVPRVAAARMSAGWALVFIAVLYTTAPAIAAFVRTNLLETVPNHSYTEMPDRAPRAHEIDA